MDIGLDIAKRLKRGRELARLKYLSYESSKLGNLRAGNSGIMSEEGDIAGACHRITHLRQLGIEIDPPSDSTTIMFQMGFANEDIILNDLKQTMAPDEVILREEQMPISWTTSNGTRVTGRPDMVICRTMPVHDAESGKSLKKTVPILGLEFKSVASVWTSRDVLVEGLPKLEHLIQASHYSWKLGVPYRLLYKQYAIQSVPSWAYKLFPQQGKPFSEYCDYGKDGKIKSVRPFEIVYDIVIGEDGQVKYKIEGSDDVHTETVVNIKDINRYYEFVSTMAHEKKLGPELTLVNSVGKKKDYSHVEYCLACKVAKTMAKEPDSPEKYDRWLKEVKQALANKVSGETK